MPDFENAASWDDADPPTRGVWYDAEPDTRERGAKPAPAPRGGYRIRSDETWARARDAYLAGETAEEVAFRFDLTLGSLRHRARQEGWRRADQDDPETEERLDDRWGHISDDEGYASLAERALYQLRRAMAQGRGGAAASWMRVHDRLIARAEAEARRKLAEENEAAARIAREQALARRSAERAAAALRDALDSTPADGSALDPEAQAEEDVIAAIEALTARVARTDPRDMAERAACEAELARIKRLNARFDAAPLAGRTSDDSDPSDPNSPAPPGDP